MVTICGCCDDSIFYSLKYYKTRTVEQIATEVQHKGVAGLFLRWFHNKYDLYEDEYNSLLDEIYTYLLIQSQAVFCKWNKPADLNETRISKLPGFIEYIQQYITQHEGEAYLVATWLEENEKMAQHGSAIRWSWLHSDYVHPRVIDESFKNIILQKMLNDGYIFIRKYVPTPEKIEQERELFLKRVREQKEQEEKENEERRKQERQQNGIFAEYVYITPEDRTYLAGVSHTNIVNDIINNTQFQ